jgi:hypothetical protein
VSGAIDGSTMNQYSSSSSSSHELLHIAMPRLTFLLTNPSLSLRTEGIETWSLACEAKIERLHILETETFKVVHSDVEYDGYKMTGTVSIQCYNGSERISSPADLSNLNIHIDSLETDGPYFLIETSLSSDAFFHLYESLGKPCSIRLHASTPLSKEGLTFGSDPGGWEIHWRIDKQTCAPLESLHLNITPLPEENRESKPSYETKQPDPTPPMYESVAAMSKLLSSINNLFWAVVIIGLLLLLKT